MPKKENDYREEIINLILGSPGIGGGEEFYSFIPNYYLKLTESEKESVKKILVELIDNDNTWWKKIVNLGDRFTFEQKTKVMFICSELNLVNAISKIEKFLSINNLNKKYPLPLFHHAVGKFKTISALPILEEQAKLLFQPYDKDAPIWSEKFTAQFNVRTAIYALKEIDSEKALFYISKYLREKTRTTYPAGDFVIDTYKKVYKEKWLEYLAAAVANNVKKSTELIYEMGGVIGRIKIKTSELIQFFTKLNDNTKKEIEKNIVQNIDEEISECHGAPDSMYICSVLQFKRKT